MQRVFLADYARRVGLPYWPLFRRAADGRLPGAVKICGRWTLTVEGDGVPAADEREARDAGSR